MDFHQLLAGPTGQDNTAELTPAADIEEEPLSSGILNAVAGAALAEHAGKRHSHDDKLASLW